MGFYATKALRKSMLATTMFTMSNTIAQYPISGLWDIFLFITALLLELIRQHFFGSVIKFAVLSALCNGVEPVPWTFPRLDCFHLQFIRTVNFTGISKPSCTSGDRRWCKSLTVTKTSAPLEIKNLVKRLISRGRWPIICVEEHCCCVLLMSKMSIVWLFVWCFKKLHWWIKGIKRIRSRVWLKNAKIKWLEIWSFWKIAKIKCR